MYTSAAISSWRDSKKHLRSRNYLPSWVIWSKRIKRMSGSIFTAQSHLQKKWQKGKLSDKLWSNKDCSRGVLKGKRLGFNWSESLSWARSFELRSNLRNARQRKRGLWFVEREQIVLQATWIIIERSQCSRGWSCTLKSFKRLKHSTSKLQEPSASWAILWSAWQRCATS